MQYKKTLVPGLAAFTLSALCAATASAHMMWADADYEPGLLKAEIGYNDTFPDKAAIVADRVHLFAPMQVVTKKGVTELTQKGENYQYQANIDLPRGDYLVLGVYHPTFWAKGPAGWKQADRQGYKEITGGDATEVGEYVQCAKRILNVDGAESMEVIRKPVGQRVEFIPQANPATIKPGGRFPVQVLVDGKPTKDIEVQATYAGFGKPTGEKDPVNGYRAFLGKTDENGIVQIVTHAPGYWIATTDEVDLPYADKSRADKAVVESQLTFLIGE